MGLLRESRKSIEVYDSNCEERFEELMKLKPGEKGYEDTFKALRGMQELKSSEIANYNAIKQNMVPQVAVGILGIIASFVLGLRIYNGEAKGAVIGSTATSMFNKMRF